MPAYGTHLVADRVGRHKPKIKIEPSWRAWYKSPTWKAIKRHRLVQEPYCRQCALEGRTVPATHVDHIESHRGQWAQFTKYENTQSLCPRHHNAHRRCGAPKTGKSEAKAAALDLCDER
jgi:5-methylcytosine-specific restriction enzyme A